MAISYEDFMKYVSFNYGGVKDFTMDVNTAYRDYLWPTGSSSDFEQQSQPEPNKIDLGWFEVVDMVETDGVWREVK